MSSKYRYIWLVVTLLVLVSCQPQAPRTVMPAHDYFEQAYQGIDALP